jgi:hypothetical protein
MQQLFAEARHRLGQRRFQQIEIADSVRAPVPFQRLGMEGQDLG